MKISRTPGPPKAATADKAASVTATSGKAFAEKLGKGAAASGPSAAAPTLPTRPASAVSVSDIGAELKAGKISPQAALDKVIERIVDKQLGANASPAMRSQVSAALRESLADDPLLAAKAHALEE